MNPIERLFQAILQAVAGIVQALIGGILGAPKTAIQRVVGPVHVRRGEAQEVVDLRHRVLREGRARSTAVFEGDRLPGTRHWVAEADEGVVGVVTVRQQPFPDGSGPQLQLRGMAVHPAWRGKGVGSAMLKALEDEVQAPLWCNARESAAAFYDRLGWRRTGEPFVIDGIGPHVRMTRLEHTKQ